MSVKRISIGSGTTVCYADDGQAVAYEDYAAVEKLCRQQHDTLEITQFRFNHRRCSLCGGWNMSPNGETDGVHTKDCVIAKALAAYAALFPKTGGAK